MKTIVLANHKGGVGKSAVATLLAQYLVKEGRRVLAVDLDHQGNFSTPIIASQRASVAGLGAADLLTDPKAVVPREPFVLVPACDDLLVLERQPKQHNTFGRNFRALLKGLDDSFDVCVVDTHPNPDIRLVLALASADFVLSPIQLNQEAIDGVRALIAHPSVGVAKIRARLNPKLKLIGLLPTLVEPTPFQRINFRALVARHLPLLIRIGPEPSDLATIPKRSAIAEAQAEGLLLWEMKKTAARETWTTIEPTFRHLATVINEAGPVRAL